MNATCKLVVAHLAAVFLVLLLLFIPEEEISKIKLVIIGTGVILSQLIFTLIQNRIKSKKLKVDVFAKPSPPNEHV
jgi:hypothetical protein